MFPAPLTPDGFAIVLIAATPRCNEMYASSQANVRGPVLTGMVHAQCLLSFGSSAEIAAAALTAPSAADPLTDLLTLGKKARPRAPQPTGILPQVAVDDPIAFDTLEMNSVETKL